MFGDTLLHNERQFVKKNHPGLHGMEKEKLFMGNNMKTRQEHTEKHSATTLYSNCAIHNKSASTLNQPDSKIKKTLNDGSVMKIVTMSNNQVPYLNDKQVEILKNSICKGVSDDEFQVFLMACAKTQLDPFMKQIYPIKRWDARLKKETLTIQTGIDGYRLIAERTEKYAPGRKPSFSYDDQGNLISATAYVKKMTADGTWHEVEAEAYLDEYCQTSLDKNTGERKKIGMWSTMERNQLAKCAESLALRKAFPAEMSGVYTREEMQQSHNSGVVTISLEQASELEMVLDDCEEKYKQWVYDHLKKQYKVEHLIDLPIDLYNRLKDAAIKNMESYREKQRIADDKEILVEQVS